MQGTPERPPELPRWLGLLRTIAPPTRASPRLAHRSATRVAAALPSAVTPTRQDTPPHRQGGMPPGGIYKLSNSSTHAGGLTRVSSQRGARTRRVSLGAVCLLRSAGLARGGGEGGSDWAQKQRHWVGDQTGDSRGRTAQTVEIQSVI